MNIISEVAFLTKNMTDIKETNIACLRESVSLYAFVSVVS